MIDDVLFSKIDKVAKIICKNKNAFGSIQLILCGDFFQLPPVKCKHFTFETDSWKEAIKETIVLKSVFRQRKTGFIKLLNRMRIGQLSNLDIKVLKACKYTKLGDGATHLYPKKISCEDINDKELNKIRGESKVYISADEADIKSWCAGHAFNKQRHR